jgi:hypothetical protein
MPSPRPGAVGAIPSSLRRRPDGCVAPATTGKEPRQFVAWMGPEHPKATLWDDPTKTAWRHWVPSAVAGSALLAAAFAVSFVVLTLYRNGEQRWNEVPYWTTSPDLEGLAPVADALAELAEPHLVLAAALLSVLALYVLRRMPECNAVLGAVGGTALMVGMLNDTWPAVFTQRMPPPYPFVGVYPDFAAAIVGAGAVAGAFIAFQRNALARWTLLAAGAALLAVRWASGDALLRDVAGGTAVGVAIAAFTVGCHRLYLDMTATPEAYRSRLALGMRRIGSQFESGAERSLWKNDYVLGFLILWGVMVRITVALIRPLGPDATRYAGMAHGIATTGTLTMPWGDVYTPGEPGPSHHYPPLYPTVLAGAYSVFGFSEFVTHMVALGTSLAAVAATYFCTRDLYGHRPGLVAAAVVSLAPTYILNTGNGYSEGLVLLLFVLALWCALKSVDQAWYIIPGAVFASLGYLTRSSLGYFFIVAGLGGLFWRVYWKGWRVLRQPFYLAGIAIFGLTVAAWALRNYSHFGNWHTSAHVQAAVAGAVTDWKGSLELLPFAVVVMAVVAFLFYAGGLPWLATLRKVPLLKDEHDSGLWVAILVPLVLAVLMQTSLWRMERVFLLHNVRYASIVIVPLTWMLIRHVRPSPSAWIAVMLTGFVLLTGVLYYTDDPYSVENKVSDQLGPMVQDGQTLAIVDTHDVYRYYFDVTANGQREVEVSMHRGADARNIDADWVIVKGEAGKGNLPDGYEFVFEEHGHSISKKNEVISVWQKESDPFRATP